MKLNIYSGRSFNDPGQYPIMPWIVNSASNIHSNIINIRDFSMPAWKSNEPSFHLSPNPPSAVFALLRLIEPYKTLYMNNRF